jgi:hypothetical protein
MARFPRQRPSDRCRFGVETLPRTSANGQDAPQAVVRDARPSDALALRPRQREPAVRRPTLRATISQRRWPRLLRPPQWRVLSFQDQAGRAARTVHSRNGTRPPAQRRIGPMRAQKSFHRAWFFSPRAWPYGWRPAAPSFAAFIPRPLRGASVHGNPSFVLISSPGTLSLRSNGAALDRQSSDVATADIVAQQFIDSSAPIPGSSVCNSHPRRTTVIRLARLFVSPLSTGAGLTRSFRSVVGRERRECWRSASRG